MDGFSKITVFKAMNKLYALGYHDLSKKIHNILLDSVHNELSKGDYEKNIFLADDLQVEVRNILSEYFRDKKKANKSEMLEIGNA